MVADLAEIDRIDYCTGRTGLDVGWQQVPDNQEFDNAFKVQWEMFLRHVEEGTPFVHDLMEGAKGVQLAELALASWREERWLDVPDLKA